jgi:hypothetical protein
MRSKLPVSGGWVPLATPRITAGTLKLKTQKSKRKNGMDARLTPQRGFAFCALLF